MYSIAAHQRTLLTGFILAGLLLVPLLGEAKTVVRSGETVSVAEEQLIEGDFYAAASTVHVSGAVAEDMVAAAGQLTINGTVGDNAFLVGGSVDVHGTINDDLRIVGGEVTIAEPVLGDVLVIGGVVRILSTASVAGDVLLFTGEATIEGSVGGNVLGTVGSLRIDGPVEGDVDVSVDYLTFGNQADIAGSVRYTSAELLVRAPDAVIGGELMHNDPVLPGSQPSAYAAVVPMLVLLFSVLVWYMLSRRSLNRVITRAVSRSPRPFLVGFIAIFALPPIITLLFVSMIGSLLGLVALFGAILLSLLGIIGVAAVLGQLMMFAFSQPVRHASLLSLTVGVIGIMLLLLLPVVGQVVILGLFVLTLGAMIDLLLRPESDRVVE